MSVALFTHPSALGHDTGPGHPECADRVRYILRVLEGQEFETLLREEAPKATVEALGLAHSHAHINAILALPAGFLTLSPSAHSPITEPLQELRLTESPTKAVPSAP